MVLRFQDRRPQCDTKLLAELVEKHSPQNFNSALVVESVGLILEGPGALLGGSWTSLDRLLDTLGGLLASLEPFLGSSFALLQRSGASLGCFLASKAALGLDFQRFSGMLKWILKPSGLCFACYVDHRLSSIGRAFVTMLDKVCSLVLCLDD